MIIVQVFVVGFLGLYGLVSLAIAAMSLTLMIDAIGDALRMPKGSEMRRIHFKDALVDVLVMILSSAAVFAFVYSALRIAGEVW